VATINRARVTWTNFPGAPGVSTFYFAASTVDMTPLRTFFQAFALHIAGGATLTVPSNGDQIDDSTGQITGVWTGPAQSAVSTTGSGAYSGATGAVVEWISNGIVNGHRPIGKTFLVPLISGDYDTNGSLSSSFLTTALTAATNMAATFGANQLVWSRPFTPPAGSPSPARPGSSHPVAIVRVPDLAAVLRSRRT